MREILFKAKRTDTDTWTEGNLLAFDSRRYIINDTESIYHCPRCDREETREVWFAVIPETVSQFTGLYDKNGVRIWENDIVKMIIKSAMNPAEPPLIFIGVCKFKDGSFGFSRPRAGVEVFTAFSATFNVDFEVIGNRFDNPDLLN